MYKVPSLLGLFELNWLLETAAMVLMVDNIYSLCCNCGVVYPLGPRADGPDSIPEEAKASTALFASAGTKLTLLTQGACNTTQNSC
uniref:Uncharacterized protein n=1 Tax=Romanomermis culicivorax TaxID=13658 RepID=A0A915I2W2_ROMCU